MGLCRADRGRCRALVANTGRDWAEADGSWGRGRDWRRRNIGNGSEDWRGSKVFCREWLKFGVERSLARIERRGRLLESQPNSGERPVYSRFLPVSRWNEMTKQRKDEKKDPPFPKPKTKAWGTPTRKDKVKIVSASLGCATRPLASPETRPWAILEITLPFLPSRDRVRPE